MKLFKYLPFALAIAAMVGCSDDKEIVNSSIPEIMENGGVVSINLSIPSTSGTTRADLANGTSDEFAVNDGTVVLFDAD